MTKDLDVNKLSSAQLEELLEQKRKEERAQENAKKKKYLKDRDLFIKRCITQAVDLSHQMREFKKEAIATSGELRDRAFDLQNQEPKEVKSFSIVTECGQFKVQVENQERQSFDEHAEVAIATIKEVLKEKFENRNKAMYNIIDDILMKNNKGDYDERLVAKLRKHEDDLQDTRFSKALDALSQSYYTTGSATYVRFYRKVKQNRWEDITMQFSAL